VYAALLGGVMLLLSRCLYFDYGVRADHPSVRYPSRYGGTEDDDHQFYTTLYRMYDTTTGNKMEIEVQHLAREGRRGLYESRVTVLYLGPSRRLHVRPGSVRLEHRTRDGVLLRPRESRSDLGRCLERTSTPACTETFSHFYGRPSTLRLEERVYVEYELDGTVYAVDTTFPLEYRYHYSWWDVMLGV